MRIVLGTRCVELDRLICRSYLEIADIVVLSADSNVRWFPHVVAAVKPLDEIARFGDAEHSWRDAVDSHDMTFGRTA